MIDRRKHPRSGTKTNTFALLRSTSIALSKIQDMSMGEVDLNSANVPVLVAERGYFLRSIISKLPLEIPLL